MGLYRDEAGLVFEADDRFAQSMGYAPVSPEEEQSIYAERGLEARSEERGALGTVNAALTGVASGATLGLTDMALAGVLPDAERERLLAEIEAHPVARFGGEALGAITTGIAAPGSTLARTPAGYLSNLAARQVETGLTRGGFRGVGQALGAMGTEGAAQSVGQYLGHVALADKEVTVEGLSGALGTGFAFGAAGGGAALGVVKGTIAARRLYSRFMDGQNAQAFESAWTRSMQEALDATEMTAQRARQRLDDLGAAKLEAMRYRNEAANMTREEQIRAQAAGRHVAPEEAVPLDEGFVGPVPLDEGIAPARGGMPTSVFQRPPEVEFDPAVARDFDARLPTPDEGPAPLIDVGPQPSGPATAIFQRPVEVAEAPAAGRVVRVETARHGSPSARKFEVRTWREGAAEPEIKVVPADEVDGAIRAEIPEGFELGALNTRVPAKLEHGVPTDVTDNTLHIVRPSELAERGVWGNELKEGGAASIKTAWSGGKKLPPVDVNIAPDGRFFVEDGNHRLQAAFETDRPLLVKFRKVPADWKPQAGAQDITERLRGARGENYRDSALDGAPVSPQIPPGAPPKPYKGRNPSREVEDAIADKARFDRLMNLGKNVEIPKGRLSARELDKLEAERLASEMRRENPPRPVYGPTGRAPFSNLRSQLSKRFNETFEEIREARTTDLLGAQTAKMERELEAALQELDAAKKDFTSVEAVPEDFFDLGAGAEFNRKVPRKRVPLPDDLDMADMQAQWRKRDKTGNLRAIESLDAAHEEALLRARMSTDPRDVGAALQDAQRLEELLERVNVSATPDVVAGDFMKGLEGGVMKIERFEKAIARVADLVGEDAHPSLQAIAKAVNDAEKDAVRKVTERATRAVEDAEEFGPVAKTPKERVTYARERQLEAQRSFDEISVQEKEAKRAAKKAGDDLRASERAKKDALKLDAKATPGGSKFGAAEGLGALELLDLPGMPSVSDLPVVGPLLGAWLKYRTLKAALGRKMGRVPATPDARVAAAASATRDRIARAVDRSFKIVERGGQIGMKNAPKLAGVLAARLYDDGEPDAKKGAPITDLAAVRARELAAYVSAPGAIERDVRRELAGVTDPDIIAAAEAHRRAAMQWLLQHAPKGPEQGMMRTVKWAPSPAQSMSFARRWEAVNDPAAAYERLAHEQDMISLEAAEALRAVYPQMFAQAQQRVMENIARSDAPVPYRKRVQMTLLYQLPLDAALSPDNLKITQSVFERKMVAPPGAPATPPAPSVAQPTNVTALYQNPFDNQR